MTKEELYDLLMNTDFEKDTTKKKVATKKAPAKKKSSNSLLSDDEKREVMQHINDQTEELASGEYQRTTRIAADGQVIEGMELTGVRGLVSSGYSSDIYNELDGRYANIFSHMNKLWCDGEGFDGCRKCSMYAKMLVEVFDKINELSGRDMSQDLCTYHR